MADLRLREEDMVSAYCNNDPVYRSFEPKSLMVAIDDVSSSCGKNMADDSVPEHIIDVARHGGTENLEGPIPQPTIGGNFMLHENVIKG